jgi:SAM-dependent methyltransferase
MLIGKSDDQDTVRMSMRWGKRRLRKKYFRGRKKSLSEQPRKYFNEKAAHWDQMVEDKTLQGLDLIIKGLEIKPGSVVLDVGTGTGILIPFLKEAVGDSGSIVALDLAEEMLKRAKEKHGEQVRYVQGDIVNTPFEDNSFDEMICNSCFPHFQDKEVAVKEMMRILKPGGRVTVCHISLLQCSCSLRTLQDRQSDIDGIAVKDARKGGGDHTGYPCRLDGNWRMLPGGPTAEILSGHHHRTRLDSRGKLRVSILHTVSSQLHRVRCIQIACRYDLVCVHIIPEFIDSSFNLHHPKPPQGK